MERGETYMRGMSSLVASIIFIMLIIMASSAIFANSYFIQKKPGEISLIGETVKEVVDVTPGIQGIRIYNFGPNEVDISTAMLIEGVSGRVLKINSSVNLEIPPQEYIDISWDALGLPTPNIADSLILVTDNGKKFFFNPVYKLSTKVPVNILKLSGRDLDLFVFISGNVQGDGTNKPVVATNIGTPVNPTQIIINGTVIQLDFTKNIMPSTVVEYVKEFEYENHSGYGGPELEFETDTMTVYDPVLMSDEGSTNFIDLIYDYIQEQIDQGKGYPGGGATVGGYLNVTLVIQGVLADGTLFEYTGTFEIFFHVATPSRNIITLYLQPQGLAEEIETETH